MKIKLKMITDWLNKESLFFPTYNDCIDEESLNKMFSHLYQKECFKEEIKNDPYALNNNSKSPKNQIINTNNTFKDENWNNLLFSKKENINEEEDDSKNVYFINNKQYEEKSKNEKVLLFEDSELLSSELLTPKKNNRMNKKSLNNDKALKNNLILSNKYDKNVKLIKHKRGPYKKKKLLSDKINFEDKCFPFKLGKGIINITTKFNYTDIYENNDISSYELSDEKTHEEFNSNSHNINRVNNISVSENDLYLMKFITKKYYYSENGRRKKVKKKRKYKSDIIRKKIKSRFHKSLKNIINENLKKAGSKMLFDCLPQCFIGNISILLNSKCFELTYKELLLTDFASELNNYRHTPKDNKKYLKNIKVLKYLEQNPEISQKSGFNIIKNLKYKDILNNYFISAEFEQSLNKLKTENETQEYIQSYIYRAKNYVKFYSNCHDNFQIEPNNEDKKNDEFEIDNENLLFFDYNI